MDEAVDLNASACHVQMQLAEQAQRRCIELLAQIRTFVNEATEAPYSGPTPPPRVDLMGRATELASQMQRLELELGRLGEDLGSDRALGAWHDGKDRLNVVATGQGSH